MPLFAAGLHFLNLIPYVLRIINNRLRRNLNNDDQDNFWADISVYQRLSHMWLNIRKRWNRRHKNPHTLIALLAGYRYVSFV